MNSQVQDSQFSMPSTPGQINPKSPTNVNLKTSASFKSFPNATKLDRTQSLRTGVRPLGPFNGTSRIEREVIYFVFFSV